MNLTLFNRMPLFDEMMRPRDDMDRAMERMLGRAFAAMSATNGGAPRAEGWIPPIDVSETDDEVVVRTEVPGIPVRDIDISITGTLLSIAGRKEDKDEIEDGNFHRCERRFGSFRRVIDLPETIDPDRVNAESENGVVTVHVAKKPGLRGKRIEVKSEVKSEVRPEVRPEMRTEVRTDAKPAVRRVPVSG